MSAGRPPVPDRWEVQLGIAALSLVLDVVQPRTTASDPPAGVATAPGVMPWQAKRRVDVARHPWLPQLARERARLRSAVGLWLAWRSYQLERASSRRT